MYLAEYPQQKLQLGRDLARYVSVVDKKYNRECKPVVCELRHTLVNWISDQDRVVIDSGQIVLKMFDILL